MNKNKERFLIVGSGGRESAFALKLSEEENISLYAVADHENPTLVDCVNDSGGKYLIGSTTNGRAVSAFANKHKIDYAFVSADAPLAHGVVDELLKKKIKAVGGTKAATRIEWDKVYSIELMQRICPEFTPFYKVISSQAELDSAISEFKRKKLLVVVKPQGLTGGKGVKVMREHLKTYQDSADYASLLLKRNKKEKVLLVEKLDGIEFTVMGITDGDSVVMAPASYDYPFRRENDKGPGTGGMGCFTNHLKRLPFMSNRDMRDCRTIMTRVIKSMKADNLLFNGVLNGGFFKTKRGIRFMEFNGRFGDPEGLNILSLLKTPFSRVIKDLWHKRLNGKRIQFMKKASVIKYLVAEEYPETSARATRFDIDEDTIEAQGINIYYASCIRAKGSKNSYVTLKKSRVFALGTVAKNIDDACVVINRAIDKHVRGALDYRKDIGSRSNLQKLMKRSKNLR